MSKIKKALLSIWKDESGQGATEYILILVVVAVMIVVFKDHIKDIIVKRTNQMGGKVESFMDQIQ